MSPDLALALSLADAADAISLARFRASDLLVETKPDLTPVTEADRAVEDGDPRPPCRSSARTTACSGEEFGITGGGTRRWIVDPIDGTRNYSRGIPVWATLIALEEDGEILLGVVSAPALHRRWHAERGGGAWVNDDRIRVSAIRQIEDAVLSFALEQPIPSLAGYAWHARGYGDFWAHMLVAEGAVDGAVDAVGVKIWDLAAIQPIVEEAGGRFSDAAGETRVDGGTAISSNGHLHDALLEAVRYSRGRGQRRPHRGLVHPVAAELVELAREQLARAQRLARRADRLAVDPDRLDGRRLAARQRDLALQPRAQPAGDELGVGARAFDAQPLDRADRRPELGEPPSPGQRAREGDVRDGDAARTAPPARA